MFTWIGIGIIIVLSIIVGMMFARRNKKDAELLAQVIKEAEEKAKELFKK